MPMDLEKAIGFTSEPQDVAWNQRDVLLYAVGIGAKRSELQWAYELSPAWHPFPTYALVLPFKGASSTVVNFADSKEASGNVHLPAINPNNFVHASQSIQILRPIPASSEGQEGWKIYKRLVSLKDTGKGLIIGVESSLVGPNGQEYVRMAGSSYAFGDYKAGGFNKSIAAKPPVQALAKAPARSPDFVVVDQTTEEQAIAYRLSGDYNGLHADPTIGAKLGFKGAILHGLGSYGFCARALCNAVGKGDGTRLTYMSARFTSPVMPGDALETRMWVSGEDGNTRVDFEQHVNGGKMSLGGGVAVLTGVAKAKL